jgi:hypothetical protein
MVRYTLEGGRPASVSLFRSFDNDRTWNKVVDDVSGDIGENVSPGEKVIFLHNLPIDGLSDARFRLIVNNKETAETALDFVQGETNVTMDNSHEHQVIVSFDEENPPTSELYGEASVLSNKQQSENRKSDTQVRKDTPQQQQQTQQQVSNNLNNAFNNIKGGSGNTTGTGHQGDPNGRGVFGDGGNAGAGDGSGMGVGGGDGSYNGVGSGSGMSWNLPGRTLLNTHKVQSNAPDEGTVTVDIWVDSNGNVLKAIANAAKSNTSNGTLLKMAEEAALKAKFNRSAAGNEQKGTFKITFKLQ